jgi:hypothetical protein
MSSSRGRVAKGALNSTGLSTVLVILTMLLLSVIAAAVASYLSARQLTYPLQTGAPTRPTRLQMPASSLRYATPATI